MLVAKLFVFFATLIASEGKRRQSLKLNLLTKIF